MSFEFFVQFESSILLPNATLIPHIQNKELLTVIRVPVTNLSTVMQYIELNKYVM